MLENKCLHFLQNCLYGVAIIDTLDPMEYLNFDE